MKQKQNFKGRVLQVVQQIPKGSVLSYKQVAKLAGNEKACRAVGKILNKNKDYAKIPCHRVIRSDGTLGGYNRGTALKGKLLRSERKI